MDIQTSGAIEGEQVIPRHFLARVKENPEAKALLYKDAGKNLWRAISRRGLCDSVNVLSLHLISKGIKKGDRVALLSENRPEWVISDLAILSIGAVAVPIYFTSSASQVGFILRDSGAKAAIVSNEEQLGKVLEQGPGKDLEEIVCFDQLSSDLPGNIKYLPDIVRNGSVKDYRPIEERLDNIVPDDTANILYTSGTTGPPKGVMLSHRNFLSNALACREVVDVGASDLFLSFLPLSHAFERTVGYYVPLISGAVIAYAESIDKLRENMLEVRPTIMLGVPRFYEKTYAAIMENVNSSPPLKKQIFNWAVDVGMRCNILRDSGGPLPVTLKIKKMLAEKLVFGRVKAGMGGRLRFFVSGGAPLSTDIQDFFDALGLIILEGYGLTETSPVIATNSLSARKKGTVGRALPGVEISIAPDGEIRTRGPHIMKGYFKRDDLTAEVLRGGWFYTGDIGSIDEEGYLVITDRKKDLIVTSGGKNVAPQNIETVLQGDTLITQAMVYGDGRKYLTALIVPNFDDLKEVAEVKGIVCPSIEELVKRDEIIEIFTERIEERLKDFARYEKIKKFALLPREFSMAEGEITPTLKIKRKTVAERYGTILEGLYEDEN